ncbi:MAG: S8 family serine peptidase [bacterium]
MKRWRSAWAVGMAAALGLAAVGVARAGQPDPERQIVVYKDGAKARKAVEAAGGKVIRELTKLNALAVKVPAGALAKLRANAAIELVEQDAPRYPLSVRAPSPTGPQVTPWGIDAVTADPQLDTGKIPVCIIDSGYDKGHEDLQTKRVTASPDPGTGDPFHDGSHHGTHVAGTISALDNAIGVVGVNGNGVLPIHIVKLFGDDGEYAYSSDLADAVGKCIDEGHAKVINMSLGGGTPTATEKKALDNALANNVLPIAAAGNDGNSRKSYPAAYDSVMSVAAVDSALAHASFSQFNDDVEIAGPGVAVRSTVPKAQGSEVRLAPTVVLNTKNGMVAEFEAAALQGSAIADVTAPLFRCNAVDGLGSPGDCAGASGKLCVIERGTITFVEKVKECKRSGGLGAVIFNNSDALFTGTLEGVDANIVIPAVSVAGTAGPTLEYLEGDEFELAVGKGNYDFFDGTSMATPHVVGVAAAVWSQNTACKARDIRALLDYTAQDVDAPGRDVNTGYGVVNMMNALAHLDCDGKQEACTLKQKGAACSSMSECCSGVCQTKGGNKTCQ